MHQSTAGATNPNRALVALMVSFVVVAAYLYFSQPSSSTSTIALSQSQSGGTQSARYHQQQQQQPPRDTPKYNRTQADLNARLVISLRKDNAVLADRLATVERSKKAPGSADFKSVPTNQGHITKRAASKE